MVTSTLAPFVRQWAVLLVTYRRDGTPIGTPVSIAVEGDRAFVRTWDTAWKLKRIRNNPEVEILPSTARGKPTGQPLRARARVLGVLVPLAHRLRGHKTVHIELTPMSVRNPGAVRGTIRPESSSAESSGSRRPGG